MSQFRFRRMLRSLAGVCTLLAACSSSTGPDDSNVNLRGSWNYSANQTGTSALLEGTFTIDQQTGAAFSGQFNGRVRDAQGTITNIAGIASGHTYGNDAIDFDLVVNGVARRHVGRIAEQNSIAGTWAQQTGTTAVGAFVLTRS